MGRLFQQNDCWHGNGALCGGGIEVICKVGCFSHKVVTFSKMPSSTGLNYWVLSSSLPPKLKHSIWCWGSTYSAVICVQSSSFMHRSWRMLERKTSQKMTDSLAFMRLCWSFFHRRNFTRNILINWNHSLSQIACFHGSVVGIQHTQRTHTKYCDVAPNFVSTHFYQWKYPCIHVIHMQQQKQTKCTKIHKTRSLLWAVCRTFFVLPPVTGGRTGCWQGKQDGGDLQPHKSGLSDASCNI